MFNKNANNNAQSPRGNKIGKGCASAAKRSGVSGNGPRTPNSSRRNKSKKFGLQCNGNASKQDLNQLNVMRLPSSESNLGYVVPVEQLEREFLKRSEIDQNLDIPKNDARSKDLEVV